MVGYVPFPLLHQQNQGCFLSLGRSLLQACFLFLSCSTSFIRTRCVYAYQLYDLVYLYVCHRPFVSLMNLWTPQDNSRVNV